MHTEQYNDNASKLLVTQQAENRTKFGIYTFFSRSQLTQETVSDF